MKTILKNVITVLSSFATTQEEKLFLEKLTVANIKTMNSDNSPQLQSLIDNALKTTEHLVSNGKTKATADNAMKTVESINDFLAVQYLQKLYELNWGSYKKQVEALSIERNLDERLLLLNKINTESLSQTQFKEMSLHSRYMIGGFETKENRAALGLGVGLFGSMRGAGKFTNLLGKNKHLLSPVIDAIPRQGAITREKYLDIVALYKNCLVEAYVERNLLKPFTRILAMIRPDIFICMTVRNCNLLRAVTNKPTLKSDDYEGYWDNYITEIHNMPWYKDCEASETNKEVIFNNRVALLDMLIYSDPRTAEIKKRVDELMTTVNVKPLTDEQAKKAITDFARQRGGDYSTYAMLKRQTLLTLLKEGHPTEKAFDIAMLLDEDIALDDAKEAVYETDAI